jgi:very-short-patch-repair endonuclease
MKNKKSNIMKSKQPPIVRADSDRKGKTKKNQTGMKVDQQSRKEAIMFLEKNILGKKPFKNYRFEKLKYIDGQLTDFHCEKLQAAIDIIPSLEKKNMNEGVKKILPASALRKQKKFQKLGYKIFTFTVGEIFSKPQMIKEILNDIVKPQQTTLSFDDFGFTFSDDGLI